jgi:hypothetical protein
VGVEQAPLQTPLLTGLLVVLSGDMMLPQWRSWESSLLCLAML